MNNEALRVPACASRQINGLYTIKGQPMVNIYEPEGGEEMSVLVVVVIVVVILVYVPQCCNCC